MNNIHEQLANYLIEAINGFNKDPADTDYQKGYLAALEEVAKVFNIKSWHNDHSDRSNEYDC